MWLKSSVHSCTPCTARCSQLSLRSAPGASPPFARQPRRQTLRLCIAATAGKGFGSASKPKKKRREQPGKAPGKDWFQVASQRDFEQGKQAKPVILANNQAVIVWLIDGAVYCTDANSTAFQFPLVDGKISSRASGPTVEVPLDGTVYDLATGEVLEWVPKNNPIRAVLNTLKSSAKPEPLKVYPVEKDDSGRIYVNI